MSLPVALILAFVRLAHEGSNIQQHCLIGLAILSILGVLIVSVMKAPFTGLILTGLLLLSTFGNHLQCTTYIYAAALLLWESTTNQSIFMLYQGSEITPSVRDKTIRWLWLLNKDFEFLPETFALTVSIFDRFLSLVKVQCNILNVLYQVDPWQGSIRFS